MKDVKFVAWPDTHVPFEDVSAVRCALSILDEFEPDEVVILGDFIDASAVSHHEVRNLRFREGKRLKQEYERANALLDAIASRTARIVYLRGNHEDWVDKYLDEHPELEGLINVEVGLRLHERGIPVIPYNQCYRLGKLFFTHGTYVGKHHASKHAEAFSRSVIYGHLHDVQVHIKVSPIDVRDKHIAMSVGCLCGKNPAFMRNRPNNWVHAIALGTVRANGTFNVEPIIITDGVATVAGRTYDGKGRKK